jgi:hypothetical protein
VKATKCDAPPTAAADMAPAPTTTVVGSWQPAAADMAPAPTTAVVVRCHDPTDAALARIGAWARSLDGSGVALVVSVDQTTQGSSRRRARRGRSRGPARRVAAVLGGLGRVHVYDERALVAAYPCLAAAAATAHVAGAREFRTGAVSLAWGFHCECLNLWYQALARKFDFVWNSVERQECFFA